MMLIDSRQALDMLSAHAPRAWCKRVLSWEVFNTDLRLYASKGHVIRLRPAGDLLKEAGISVDLSDADRAQLENEDDDFRLPILRTLEAAHPYDKVETIREDWQGREDDVLPFGLIPASTINWEAGSLVAELLHGLIPNEWLAATEETFEVGKSETLVISLSGLRFELNAIEMLAPGAAAPPIEAKQSTPASKKGGRPIKWNWEGALAHIASLANKPDGLPTDAGAQARIARLITDWFITEAGEAPADSEVRKRAATILEALTRR